MPQYIFRHFGFPAISRQSRKIAIFNIFSSCAQTKKNREIVWCVLKTVVRAFRKRHQRLCQESPYPSFLCPNSEALALPQLPLYKFSSNVLIGRICGIKALAKHILLCWPWPHHPIAQFQCYGRILSQSLTCPVDWTRSPLPTHAFWPLCGSCYKHARHFHVGETVAARTGVRTGLSPPAPASDSGVYIHSATEGIRSKGLTNYLKGLKTSEVSLKRVLLKFKAHLIFKGTVPAKH